jgi:hypothetical protein
MQETLIERSLLSEFEGDLPQAIGVVVVHCVRGNATGVAAALIWHGGLGAVFVVTAGDGVDLGTGGQEDRGSRSRGSP